MIQSNPIIEQLKENIIYDTKRGLTVDDYLAAIKLYSEHGSINIEDFDDIKTKIPNKEFTKIKYILNIAKPTKENLEDFYNNILHTQALLCIHLLQNIRIRRCPPLPNQVHYLQTNHRPQCLKQHQILI
ncbi:MAG: hypothetical protein QG673_742 [Pseudomonadota bacterium]|nr:hypothetical protein [Pseudomonadota bacterium]